MYFKGMLGLGDNIYQRAFISKLKGVYLETPWPELYSDIDVKCVRPSTNLRTQAKNISASVAKWHQAPNGPCIQVAYGKAPIMQGMERCFGFAPGDMSLPPLGDSPVSGRYIVVRPVTVRAEWRADTRNPLPEHISHAAREAMRRGYKVVSVADLEGDKEWAVGELPEADVAYHAGELSVLELLALVSGAAGIIGGIGWIVPASIAARVPAFVVCGGQGAFNSPEHIVPTGQKSITFAVPDNLCMCSLKEHDCDKRISDYEQKFAEWIKQLPAVD